MTVETVNPQVVDIGDEEELAVAWGDLRMAQEKVRQAEETLDAARERFDRLVGDRTTITAAGRELAHYKHDGRFSTKKFTEAFPHLAEQFTAWRAESYIDEAALRAAHPMLFEEFRARTLRPVGSR
jgi:hypothetical protein